jgi:uncharacterized protein YhjY with autotransporter beta-barrel domain
MNTTGSAPMAGGVCASAKPTRSTRPAPRTWLRRVLAAVALLACGQALAQQAQTIDFPAASQTHWPYDSGTGFYVNPPAVASSGLPVTYSSLTPSVCTWSSGSNMVAIQGAGTCTIAANQAGDQDYAAAPQVTRTYTITKHTNPITFNPPANVDFVPNGTFQVEISSLRSWAIGLPVTSSLSPSVCTISGTEATRTVTMLSEGDCQLRAYSSGGNNYVANTVDKTVTLAIPPKTAQSITFGAQQSQTYASGLSFNLDPLATASSGLPVSYSSQTPGVCSISGTTVSALTGGNCIIAANQAGDDDYSAAPAQTQTITIDKLAQTIDFTYATSLHYTYNGTFELDATASSGLPVAYQTSTPTTCQISGSTVTMKALGGCALMANQFGNDTYAAATTVYRTIHLETKPAQTITFGAQAAQAYSPNGKFQIDPLATASSGLPVTYSSLSTQICTISGTEVTMLGAGSCVIAANQAGGADFAPASQAQATISIAKAAQVINFPAPVVPTFVAGATFELSATASSGLNVLFSSEGAACTVLGSTVHMVSEGACTVQAYQAGDLNYQPASVQSHVLTLAVKPGQSITFPAQAAQAYAPGKQFSLDPVATASSGLAVGYTSLTSAVCTVSGSTVSVLGTGTCTIAANQAGNADFAAATQVTRDISIEPASQTISFAQPVAPVFSVGGTFSLSATASSSLPVSFSTSSAACSVTGSTVTMISEGDCVLLASQAGDTHYEAAPTQTRTVTLAAQQAQTISFGTQAAQTYGPGRQFAINPAASASSGLAVVYSSLTTAVCTVSGSTVSIIKAGTCTIAADQAGNAAFTAATRVTQAISIDPAPQTISFPQPLLPGFTANGTFGVSATASSGLPVEFSARGGNCMVAGNTVTMLAEGECIVAANQSGNDNYLAASEVSHAFVLDLERTQAISFGTQPAQLFEAGGTFALNPAASANSGLPVSYSSLSTGICSISGTTVTMHASGNCVIAADQAGNEQYPAAEQVRQTIAIGKRGQAIAGFTASVSAPAFVQGGRFELSAQGGASALPVVFASATPTVCSVAGSSVTMLSAGTCTLTADQAGNDSYATASQVRLDVVIGMAAPSLAWIGQLQKFVGDAAFELPEPETSSNGAITYTSSVPSVATIDGRTVTLVGAGQTTLTARQAATANHGAAEVSVVLVVGDRPPVERESTTVSVAQAQTEASQRFVSAQLGNINDRLRLLRTGNNPSSSNLSFGTGGQGPGLSLNSRQATGTRGLPQGVGVWTAGVITLGQQDARSASQGFKWRSDGVSAGIDFQATPDITLGAAFGVGWTDTDLDDKHSRQDARQRSASFYGQWRATENLYLDGLLGWGRLDFDMVRWSAAANASARGEREGRQAYAALTFGYERDLRHGTLTGYGRYDTSRSWLDGYSERGLDNLGLRYGDQTLDSGSVALGVENRYSFKTRTALLRPFWTAEYRVAVSNRGTARVNYLSAPTSSDYLVSLRNQDTDMFSVGGGVDIDTRNGWLVSLLLRREQGSHIHSNSLGFSVRYGRPPQPVAGLSMEQVPDDHYPQWLDAMLNGN